MKKRICAFVILTLMLLSMLAMTAAAFPFGEYNSEKNNLRISIGYDYDTDNDKALADQGLAFARTITYTGYQGRRWDVMYEQNARITVKLPDDYFYLENSHLSDPDSYYFTASESGSFYKWYEEEGYQRFSDNDVSWGMFQEIFEFGIYKAEDDETIEEAMEKKADFYKDMVFETWYSTDYIWNTSENPVSVEKDANGGYKIVTDGFFDDTKYWTIEEDWGGFKESYSEGRYYTRIMPIRELPELYLVVCFRQRRSLTAKIEGPAHTDYKAVYDKGKERIAEYWSKNIGEQFLNLESLMTITWEEPTIALSENGDTSETEQNAGITQNAEETPGEDGGVSVPAAIVIGVAGGGAAIAAAAAASGEGGDKNKKGYKMYVQKDFGDAIRRGGDPVKVRARMAEVSPGGAEVDRPDLTGQIGVTGDGITVHGAALAGRYCEATLSVPKDYNGENASVTFIFHGEGGSFSNTVIFRLVEGPTLKFVDEEGNGSFRTYHSNAGIDMIPGDGFTYSRQFMIVDATVPPELADISAEKVDGYDISFEKTNWQYVYKVIVKNNTKRVAEHDIFDKPQEKQFEISVNVKDEKEPLKGYVTMNMYPEGLTVQSRDMGNKGKIKYIFVQAYEKEHVGDLDKKWQVSEMKFTLAVIGRDCTIIDPKEAEFKFDKLKGAGGVGTSADKEQAIADKYKYVETYGWIDDKYMYQIEPRDMLWEPDNGTFFMVNLPVWCEYEGNSYKADVPMRLRGKDMDPMEAWEKEYAKTRERIEKFSLPDQKAYNLQQLEKIASNDTCRISTWELRLMAKDVVRAYMRYWTEQNEKDKWTAAALDWTVWGLEWVKWIGDCAFSYVVAAYTGPLEAIITPAKDVLVNAIGEVGVNIVWGTKFDVKNLEIYDQIKNAGDNFVSGGVSDGVSWLASSGMSNPAKIKYACAILGAYFAFAVFNNYLLSLEKGENDFYGAIVGAFKDLTVTAVKIAASMLFKKWLESDSFKKKIGPKLEEFMQKWFGENLQNQKFNVEAAYNESQQLYGDLALKKTVLDIDVDVSRSGIIEKYLTELCGMGAGYVYDEPAKAQHRLFWFNPAGEIMFTFCIRLAAGDVNTSLTDYVCDINMSKVLSNTGNALFGWMYDLFFGGVPTATAVIEMPKDPPLPPAKQ